MATELKDVLEIVENTKDFILLEFTGSRVDLIKTGVFNGNEEMVRVTKGENHTMTFFYKDGKTCSFDFGIGGYTLISEGLEKKKRAIISFIEGELETSLEDTTTTNLPQSKADCVGKGATFKVMHFEGDTDRYIHKNGKYYRHVVSEEYFLAELLKQYKSVESVKEYTAPNGCIVEELLATGKF